MPSSSTRETHRTGLMPHRPTRGWRKAGGVYTPVRSGRQAAQGSRQGNLFFHCSVGQAQFERRPTLVKRREILVGRRGETPLVQHCSALGLLELIIAADTGG